MNISREELEKLKAQLTELLNWVDDALKHDPQPSTPPRQECRELQPTTLNIPPTGVSGAPANNPQHSPDRSVGGSNPQPTTPNFHPEEPVSGIAIHERTGCIVAAIAFTALAVATLFLLPHCIYQ